MNKIAVPVKVAQGVWRITLNHPRVISNVYLIEGDEPVLIDSGPSSPEYLPAALGMLGYQISDINKIIYTHHHTDHFGGGAVLPETFSGSHCVHADWVESISEGIDSAFAKIRNIPRAVIERYPVYNKLINRPEELEYYRANLQGIDHLNGKIKALNDLETLDLGSRKLQIVWVPGHSAYHIALIDHENKLAFGGDLLLNYGPSFVFVDDDNVASFLESLIKFEMAAEGVEIILPGHGSPFVGELSSLVDKVRKRIHTKGQDILDKLTAGPKSCIELFDELYPGQRLSFVRWGSTFYTMLTHVKFLEETGRITECKEAPGVYILGRQN